MSRYKLGISPTPWTYSKDAIHGIESNGITICNAWETQHVCKEIAIANARLIAAAPDCYEALRTAVNVIEEVLGSEDMQANCHNGTVFKLSVCKQKMIEALEKASGEDQNEVNA